MPVRDGLPVPERGRYVPPRDTTTGPPEHPVEHRAVIGPPATPTRSLVGQQRFQTSPFRIGQIVSMQNRVYRIQHSRSAGHALAAPVSMPTAMTRISRTWVPLRDRRRTTRDRATSRRLVSYQVLTFDCSSSASGCAAVQEASRSEV